jgi:hypothetical protein
MAQLIAETPNSDGAIKSLISPVVYVARRRRMVSLIDFQYILIGQASSP